MVKISIIMPVYNGEKFIEKSIESVSKQSLKDIELICIDDGSTDNSLNLLKKLSEKYTFIKILTQTNQGSGKARNYGIDEAKGKYIAFIDADDIFVDSNALEVMYKFANKYKANMVSANLKELLPNGDLIYNSNYEKDNYCEFKEYEIIEPVEYGVPWAFYKNIYKKQFLDEHEIRFRDLIRGQDPVFLAEVLAKLDKIYGVPVVLYAYLFPTLGKPYSKVNSKKKITHYLTHYKKTFDILEESNLIELSDKYKPKLFLYLKYAALEDIEAFEIFLEIFEDYPHYFSNFRDEIDQVKILYLITKINKENNESVYDFARKEISKMDILSNKLITKKQYRLLYLMLASHNYEDYKKGYSVVNLINLRETNTSLTKKNNDLKKKNQKLKKQYKSLK